MIGSKMILKIKQNNSWRFIDGIQDVTTPILEETVPKEVFIRYTRNGEHLTQNVLEGCYLLNDLGKTIEKIS